jgi:transposase
MTKPLSVDLRVRLARYVEAGHSRRQAARVFGIGASSAIRIVARYERTGSVEPARQGGDRRSKMKSVGDYVLRRVCEVPDISLGELVAELAAQGISIHFSNVSRYLKSRGLTYKKNGGRSRTEATGCPPTAGGVDQGASADHAQGNPSPCLS